MKTGWVFWITCKVNVWKNSNYFDIKIIWLIQQKETQLARSSPELKAGLAVPSHYGQTLSSLFKTLLLCILYCLPQWSHSRNFRIFSRQSFNPHLSWIFTPEIEVHASLHKHYRYVWTGSAFSARNSLLHTWRYLFSSIFLHLSSLG